MKQYPLTQPQFDALRARLEAAGVSLSPGYYGTLLYKDITLKYNFDGQTLTLSVLQKPFLIPAAAIWDKVDKWMTA